MTPAPQPDETPDQRYRRAVTAIVGVWIALIALCILFALTGLLGEGGGRSGALVLFVVTGPIWVPVLIYCARVRKSIEDHTQLQSNPDKKA